MPPEPSSLDRKDLFKEKRGERPDALAPSPSRWKDPRRGAAGLCKQGSYQGLSEESGRGCTPSRPCERPSEGDGGRPSVSGAEGRYGRGSGNGNRLATSVSGGHRDWEGLRRYRRSWDAGMTDASSSLNSAGGAMSTQRSVDDLLVTDTYHTHFDVGSLPLDDSHFKDQHDKLGSLDGLGTGQVFDKDHSLGSITWKALKWTRSGSLSSRASGLGQSSGLKSTIKTDCGDSKIEALDGKESLLQSPSEYPTEGFTSTAPVEEACPRKKQRLGWGQGLAKYEKEKVEGPEDNIGKIGSVHLGSSAKDVNNTGTLSLPDTSPKVGCVSVCMSPATLFSVACSSSSDLGDKLHLKVTNCDNDLNHFSNIPGQGFRKCSEELSSATELLELDPIINNIKCLLANLLLCQDISSGDYDFVQSAALNKLLLLKSDILKSLEKTECEIDLFENELKSLDFNSEMDPPCPTPSELFPTVALFKPCQEQAHTDPKLSAMGQIPCNDCLDGQAEFKEEDVYSPGTVTSELSEPPSIDHRIGAANRLNLDACSADSDVAKSVTPGHCSVPVISTEVSTALCHGEDGNPSNLGSSGTHAPCAVSAYCEAESSPCELIFASNEELASEAMRVFDKVLTTKRPQTDTVGPDNSMLCRKGNLHIQEKIFMDKHFQKFKECVLALKFKAFYHLWKEDLRLLSLRKNGAKSQKQFELGCRSSHSGYQKHRSSSRSRFNLPGSSTLVPTTQIANFTSSKLLSDSQIKHYRDSLKMPALNLDQRHSRFITTNGLVEDPCAVEKERTMINPWMEDEKEIFMEKLLIFGKDFAKIASFLSHKTTADCVEFYYKNHKSESFEKVKKILDFEKVNKKLENIKQLKRFPTHTYMVSSGKKWNPDANATSLDILGAASAVASYTDDSETRKLHTGVSIVGFHYFKHEASVVDDDVSERTSYGGVPRNDSEAAAADVLASICGSISAEAMNSCVTSSPDAGEGLRECAALKAKSIVMDRPFTPEISQNIDEDDTFSDDSCGELDSADWTDEEKSSFIIALRTYGKDFTSISKFVRTRSRDQCKIFFSKARKCLGLDQIHQEPDNEGTRLSDAGCGRSDIEDAGVMEMDSAICSTQSCSKVDMDVPLSVPNRSEGSGNSENKLTRMELDGGSEKNEVSGTNLEVADGMKEGNAMVHQSMVMQAMVLDGDNVSLREDDDQRGSVPDESTVPHLDDENGEVRGASETCSYVQVNSVSTEVPLEHCQSTLHSVVEPQQEGQSHCRPSVGVEPIEDSKSGCSVKFVKPESEPVHYQVQETSAATDLNDVSVPGSSADGSSCSTSLQDLPVSNGNGRLSHKEVKVDTCPSAASVRSHQNQMPLELHHFAQKSHILSWQLKENWPSGLANASEVHHDDCLSQVTKSLPCEDQGNKQEIPENSDFLQQRLPMQVFRGYPLRMLNKREMTKYADLANEKPVQRLSKINRDCQSSQSLVLETCDVSQSPVLVPGLSYLSHSCKRSQDMPSSQVLEKQVAGIDGTEEPSLRTGDVKLFGQILSHLSPSKKERNNKVLSSKPSQSISINFSDVNRKEVSNYVGQQEFPVTSFGAWEVNKIHNGLPLSGSTVLSTIHNYPVPTCLMEPWSQSAVLRRNDRVLGCMLGYPTNDATSDGRLEYHQLHQSYEGTNMKPFSIDMKRQEHSGFETSRFQQQGNVLVGVNGVGGGMGIGGCASVSDPVAALKKHFANEARSGSGSACAIREDESWSGGDVCR